MSLKGVWSSEIVGPYGWESIGTVFLKKGRVTGGGAHHYSFGHYRKKKDGSIVFEIEIHQFGRKRPLFGKEREHFPVRVEVRRHGDRMEGEARIPGRHDHRVLVRYRKRSKFPG